MGQEQDLLRMLEPAVRPVGPGPAGSRPPAGEPFEGRSFEDLLHEAREQTPEQPASGSDDEPANDTKTPPNPLARLAGLDAVENGSLLQVMQRRAAQPQPPADANRVA